MDGYGPVKQWLREMEIGRMLSSKQHPNYWSGDQRTLITTSSVHNVSFGTGQSIYTQQILPAIAAAESEVILVTCFWSPSPTLDALSARLRQLSDKALRTGRRIRVRICFSSSSFFQKLFHTQSLSGRTYESSEWSTKLGLPRADELLGLDMEVKSVFLLPFSVMHPKFVIIDRSTVYLPSCNVSWEQWFEGCVSLSGRVTEQFVRFWGTFWAGGNDEYDDMSLAIGDITRKASDGVKTLTSADFNEHDVPTICLPSPHHRNPRFTLPWRPCAPPPSTPLSTFLLAAFSNASRNIYLQTPNLTSPPVLSALLGALRRGVNVTILTSERLMILEQLVTAGTTTKRCIAKLVKRHGKLFTEWKNTDVERGLARPGLLRTSFYQPSVGSLDTQNEPVQSHLKLTIIDHELAIFGSGNMDRASWYTSQELGVAIYSSDVVSKLKTDLDGLMQHRTR